MNQCRNFIATTLEMCLPVCSRLCKCDPGRAEWGRSSNLVLRTVASFPNLGNDENRLVGVDTALGLPSSVYLGFALQGYKSIDRRSLAVFWVGLTTSYPIFICGTFWINIVGWLILFVQPYLFDRCLSRMVNILELELKVESKDQLLYAKKPCMSSCVFFDGSDLLSISILSLA
jgi:hypothetical protein